MIQIIMIIYIYIIIIIIIIIIIMPCIYQTDETGLMSKRQSGEAGNTIITVITTIKQNIHMYICANEHIMYIYIYAYDIIYMKRKTAEDGRVSDAEAGSTMLSVEV